MQQKSRPAGRLFLVLDICTVFLYTKYSDTNKNNRPLQETGHFLQDVQPATLINLPNAACCFHIIFTYDYSGKRNRNQGALDNLSRVFFDEGIFRYDEQN